jgi:ribosome maturation factor RimP
VGFPHSFIIKEIVLDRKRPELKMEINRLAEETGLATGIQVVNALFIKEHGRRILRVTINREGVVSLDDCEIFSRHLNKLLDREDLIQEKYYIEVQSPGI